MCEAISSHCIARKNVQQRTSRAGAVAVVPAAPLAPPAPPPPAPPPPPPCANVPTTAAVTGHVGPGSVRQKEWTVTNPFRIRATGRPASDVSVCRMASALPLGAHFRSSPGRPHRRRYESRRGADAVTFDLRCVSAQQACRTRGGRYFVLRPGSRQPT